MNVDPNLLFKLATIRKQVSNGARQGIPKLGSLTPPAGESLTPDKGQFRTRNPRVKPLTMPSALPNVTTGFAKGGEPKDNMIAPVESGEYVIPKEAVDKIGAHNLDHMVKSVTGMTPPKHAKGYAMGGKIRYGNPQASKGSQDAVSPFMVNPETGGTPDNIPNPFEGGRIAHFQPPQNNNINFNLRSGFNRDRPDNPFADERDNYLTKRGYEMNPWNQDQIPNFNQYGGYLPNQGWSNNGATAIPTFWDNQGYPYAVPNTGYSGGTNNNYGSSGGIQ